MKYINNAVLTEHEDGIIFHPDIQFSMDNISGIFSWLLVVLII